MIIKKIEIQNLHDEYNYEVEFDSQLTFLYGSNGCGKTTILNILASIVTGRLYNLSDYSFNNIQLTYTDKNNNSEKIEIIVKRRQNDIRNMEISFKTNTYCIEDINNLREKLYRKAEDDNLERIFFSIYPFAEKIKRTFNYVYLPLNRNVNDTYATERDYFRYINRRHFFSNNKIPIIHT